jgi:hypothetical protein
MNYYCQSEQCTFEGDGPYKLSLPPQVCVDEHNCATIFCPYCHNEMIRKPEESNVRR